MLNDEDYIGGPLKDVPAEAVEFYIMEHRRQPLGGTKHKEYPGGPYETWDAANSVREQLEREPEWGVSFSIEHRLK